MGQAQTSNTMIDQGSAPQQALPEHSDGIRIGAELMRATAPFASELRGKSWWYVGSTFVLLTAALSGAALAPWWPLRLALSVLGGLLLVRAFIPTMIICTGRSCGILAWPGCCSGCMRPLP